MKQNIGKSALFPYHLGEAGMPIIEQSPLVMECEVIVLLELHCWPSRQERYVAYQSLPNSC